jgi:DNA primase catalytic core
MSLKQDPEHAYCFACRTVVDVFSAAHYLEGKPLKGYSWVEDNLMYLAKKYDVQLEMADLTEEEIYKYRTYQAYRLAAEMVADLEIGDYSKVNEEYAARSWDAKRCAEWGIGTVDFEVFRERLKQAGFESGFLDGIDLNRSNLFNENNLIFTVFDDKGRPVGFSARNLKYTKDKDTAEGDNKKFNATRTTGLTCNIFKKGERLYGFDLAKEASSPLYIFEGQADVITARHFGYMNCCCVLGNALTDHHINLLKKHGIFNIVIVFDSDEGGDKGIQRTIDEKLAPHKEFRIRLIHLPNNMDPDQLFREKGAEEFVKLKRWDVFEWRLAQFPEGSDPEEIIGKMIPIILADKNHIHHEKMAKTLARITGFDASTIMSEVKRQRSEKDRNLAERKVGIIENALWKAKQNPDEADLLLTEARANIEDMQRKYGEDAMASASMLEFVLSQKEADEAKSGEFAGFHMSPQGLGSIGNRLNDDWRKDTWMCIGGSSQAGKSSLCAQLAYEIAADERNNATVIYHSIDDAARFILFKLVANAADDVRLKLGYIANPSYWKEQEEATKILKLREKGYKKIIELIKDNRLLLKDSSDSPSLSYAENLIRYNRELYPDRNIVLIIDNFHKIPDYSETTGHERIKRISNHVKQMTTSYHATIISTVEYRKSQESNHIAGNQDIADSRAIEYDSSCVLHLHNDLHARKNNAILVHEWEGEMLPRLIVDFGKNKISGYEGKEFLDFFPASARMFAVDKETTEKECRAREEFLKTAKSNRLIS